MVVTNRVMGCSNGQKWKVDSTRSMHFSLFKTGQVGGGGGSGVDGEGLGS